MPLSPDEQVSAAELVLGLVEGEERAALLRRVLAEPEFAEAVREWREALAALLLAYPAEQPPAELERKLTRLGADVRPWRWATAAATIAAAVLGGLLIVRPIPTPPTVAPPKASVTYAAAMTPTEANGAKAFAAVFDPAAEQVRVPLPGDVPAGRVAQLWRIGADGVPHSLGLLRGAGVVTIRLEAKDRAALANGATLAVSIEPLGGSPATLPTGPVVATGALTRL